MTAAAPFDRIAAGYDSLWTDTSIGRAQRDAVWRVTDRFFRRGDQILDIGCGTGSDAIYLQRRGIHVTAIDASPAMVRIAHSRGVSATRLAVEELDKVTHIYDGILSNFGVLNCAASPEAMAASLARRLRPGGYAILCLLNRACVWEMAWFAVQLRIGTALRRLRPHGAQASLGLRVSYPAARALRCAFAPAFELVESRGIGIFVPPSYVRLPAAAVRVAARADRWMESLPLMRSIGDHRLFVFQRRLEC